MNTRADRLPGLGEAGRSGVEGGWSSRFAFVMAAAGSAVGLGNVWKFPYIAGEYGGGAFVLVYLACVALVGLPVLAAEILIGKRGGGSPMESFRELARGEGSSPRWTSIAWLGMLCAFLILSFYSVVAGWSLSYLWQASTGALTSAEPGHIAARMEGLFDALLANPTALILGHTLVMSLTMAIVVKGVRRGLEKAVRLMVPGLFVLLVGLVVYAAVYSGQFGAAARFLFAPDFGALTWDAVLVALGHAFFTLSVGMTAMMAYGAHLRGRVRVAPAATAIAGLDTLVALLAGLAIFPIVFAQGLEPGAGPGLIFVTLPIAFAQMPAGGFVAATFFLFLAIAALSSTISILEPVVEYLERRPAWSRRRATVVMGSLVWAVGVLSALSFNIGSEYTLFGKSFFDCLDFVTSNVLLPVGGLGVVLYAGYALSRRTLALELGIGSDRGLFIWRSLLRYVCPAAIAVVLYRGLVH